MRKSDVLAFYGTQTAVAKVLNITKSAVNQWGAIVPEGKAYRLQELSRRKLKVDPTAYARSSTPGRAA